MPKSIDMFNHYLPLEFYDRIIALGGNAHMMDCAVHAWGQKEETKQQYPCVTTC